MVTNRFDRPLVAILRGLAPADAPAIGAALFGAGFRLLEVPLNRPGALEAIRILAALAPPGALVGGGTMLTVDHADQVFAAGGRLLVAPNCNAAVIRRGADLGMLCAPGVTTPTEAFAALDAGAHALKIFPAETVGTAGLKAIRTVLPADTPLWPVGGITPESMAAWMRAGATGFGIGGALFQPGATPDDVARRADAYVTAWPGANVKEHGDERQDNENAAPGTGRRDGADPSVHAYAGDGLVIGNRAGAQCPYTPSQSRF